MNRYEIIFNGFKHFLSLVLGVSLIDLTSVFSFSFIDLVGEDFKWFVIISGFISIALSIAIKVNQYKHEKKASKIKEDTEKEKLYREINKTDHEIIKKELTKSNK